MEHIARGLGRQGRLRDLTAAQAASALHLVTSVESFMELRRNAGLSLPTTKKVLMALIEDSSTSTELCQIRSRTATSLMSRLSITCRTESSHSAARSRMRIGSAHSLFSFVGSVIADSSSDSTAGCDSTKWVPGPIDSSRSTSHAADRPTAQGSAR